ncbi:hypothetical protein M8C21_009875 [Ambrosia artemisiifolia]|uniref:C3H1-type domain-containing protein n=1 Tax=Ambrosia artemisiifolia TaxID=4212 RepID=A0AAD5GV76_AMBAR|nr:hypothetical protein M8C21_009875 [Ambrosia artemisiifolia]
MWELGLGGEDGLLPVRPNEVDCVYYLRTGSCGYGSGCRFNHPRDRGGGSYPVQTEMSKFGASRKYHHPRQGIGSPTTMALNVSGYPLRPGEKECSYFVNTGKCKFGVTCKFDHPQPAGMKPSPPPPPPPPPAMPPTMYPNVQSPIISSQPYGVLSSNWPIARAPLVPGPYLPGTYGPMLVPPGMVPFPGWNPYQAPMHLAVAPNTQPIHGGGSMYAMTQLSPSAHSNPLTKSQNEHAFVHRPSQTECRFYTKKGGCKYGASCKYRHPLDRTVPNATIGLSPMGLPLHPGAPLCSHYAQNGVCKFGPSCKYDHPMGTLSYSPSASSLADVPVAPYPVGSFINTLAPSSSLPELTMERHSTTLQPFGSSTTTHS